MLNLIAEDFERERALKTLGQRLAAAGETEMLFETFRGISAIEDQGIAFQAAAAQLAADGKLELACQCASQIRGSKSAAELVVGALGNVARRLIQSSQRQDIPSAIRRVSHRPTRDRLRTAVAMQIVAQGDQETARMLCAQIEDTEAKGEAAQLIHFTSGFGGTAMQKLALAETLESGCEKDLLLMRMGMSLEKAGQEKEALQMASKIGDADLRQSVMQPALTAGLERMVDAGEIDRAIRIASSPKIKGNRAWWLTVVAGRLARLDKRDRVHELLAEAIDYTKWIKLKDARVLSLFKIAQVIASRPLHPAGYEPKQAFDEGDRHLALRTLDALAGCAMNG